MQMGERDLELLKVMVDGKLYTLKALTGVAAQRDWEAAGRLARLAELGLVEALELRKAGRQGLERAKAYRITPEGLKAIGAPQPAEPNPAARAEQNRAVRLGERELQLLKLMADGALWGRDALRTALAAEGAGEVAGPLGRLVELGLAEVLELRTAVREGGFASVPVYRIAPQGLALLERESRVEGVQLGDLQQRPPPRAGVPTPQPERRLEGLDHRALELLRAMADERLYTLSALIETTGWHEESTKKHLERLIELKLVEALELRKVSWKRGELGSVKVYRIAPEGLKAIGAPQPPAPPSGATPSRASGGREEVDRAEERMRARDLLLLRAMADGAVWGIDALCFALARATRTSASSGGKRMVVRQHLKRLIERGEVEALELRLARKRGGLGARRVYHITRGGLEALERAPPQLELLALKPQWYNPARLLKVMEGGGLWTARALAKATGWSKGATRKRLQRLAEQGLIEILELRKVSRESGTLLTERVYRLARNPATSSWRGRRVKPQASGRPSLDILAAMSDGALWTLSALTAATRYKDGVVKWHLERLVKLGLAEAVEVRGARRRGPGFASACVYRITQKGLEALERGPPPELEPPLFSPSETEPPEDKDPVRLALWTIDWSPRATRILLHLRAREGCEDSWSGVALAAGGYRYMVSNEDLSPILFQMRELGLLEWELLSPERSANLPGHPKRILRLTERGRQVAEAILKLAALLREGGAESF
jgi:DNA-binding PadR family transcriptional regulator